MTHLKVGTVVPQVTTHRCGRRLVSSALPGSSTEAMVLSVSTFPATLLLVSKPSNSNSRVSERPSAPVNSSWIPASWVLFAWLFFCQGTVLSTCSSLGLYCASTWMWVSRLAIETTPDFELGCRKLLIGRDPRFGPGRHPS